jgi:hypothetical protein
MGGEVAGVSAQPLIGPFVEQHLVPPGASMPGAHDFTERRAGRMLGAERGA